jgi:hypothetical protein
VLAASIAFASPALADAAGDAKTQAARVEAEKRLEEGLQRYARGDYEGARVAFAQAYAVLTSIDLLFNLSRAEVKSGHPLEALVHVRQILRDPASTPEDRAKAAKLLDEANAATGHVAVEAPAGTEVVIDAVPSGECPFREAIDVAPGKHVIEARVNGEVKRIEIVTASGETVTARFEVAAGAPGAPPAAAMEAKGANERHAEAPRSSSARTVVPLVLGGAALVAVGIGVVFGLESQSHESDVSAFRAAHPAGFCFDRTSADCGQYQSLLDSQQQATNIERVAFVAGGVLAVGALATWALWPRARVESKSGAWIAPAPGGVRAGVSF